MRQRPALWPRMSSPVSNHRQWPSICIGRASLRLSRHSPAADGRDIPVDCCTALSSKCGQGSGTLTADVVVPQILNLLPVDDHRLCICTGVLPSVVFLYGLWLDTGRYRSHSNANQLTDKWGAGGDNSHSANRWLTHRGQHGTAGGVCCLQLHCYRLLHRRCGLITVIHTTN